MSRGAAAKKTSILTTYGPGGAPAGRYKLTNARVTKYETVAKIDGFAIKQQIAPLEMEKITIVCERLDRF